MGEVLQMIAVITGATGLVGSRLLQGLIADREVSEIKSVSRRPTGIKDQKLREVIIEDFSTIHKYESELRGEIYFCCLGTTIKKARTREAFRRVDFEAIVEFGKIAKKHSAKSFVVVSASGADPKSRIFYNRVKGETESALRSLGLDRLVILRPALLIGDRNEARPIEAVARGLMRALSPVLPDWVRSRIMTDAEAVARRMLQEGKSAQPGVFVLNAIELG